MPKVKEGKRYYRAHEVGYPEDEILNIKIFTSVGGKKFDKIERMLLDVDKREKVWYLNVFGSQLTDDGKFFTEGELNDADN